MNNYDVLTKAMQRWFSAPLLGGLVTAVAITATPVYAQDDDSMDLGEDMPEILTTDKLADTPEINKAPPPDERRMYVVDPAAFDVLTKVMPIDGASGDYLGTMDTGLLAVPQASPKDGMLYIADTRYSMHSRWDKDDIIVKWDPRELKPLEVIDIPNTRSGAMVHNGGSAISNDGKYFYSYQFTPVNGIVIVDLEKKKYLDTIETSQCWYVYATGKNRFAVRCRDGSMTAVTHDANGKEVSRVSTDPIHPPVDQPTYNDPAWDQLTGQMYLVSFWGKVYPVDLSGDKPVVGKSWDLLTKEERDNKWAPGGWQPLDYHAKSGRLFVAMDRRAKWAHTSESNEVWVYDVKTQKRVKKINLAHSAANIAVDRADKPHLYAVSSHNASLDIYDVETGKLIAHQGELGHEPRLLVKNP
ncbi:MAG: amine dehydrogenase large subunit [Gammaproteobacteria bacterium]